MSDPENFLTRWSRRKRAAADEPGGAGRDAQEQRASDASPVEPAASDAPPSLPATAESGAQEPSFDLSTLPPIESITAETDLRAFLAPGVPAELRLAALRRAWVADPKVRDFVGLNDYDFDFHTPGAIRGFGPLEMTDELRREVARIVGGASEQEPNPVAMAASSPPPDVETGAVSVQTPTATGETNPLPPSGALGATVASDATPAHPAPDQDELIGDEATRYRNTNSVASQQEHPPQEGAQTLARRGHGGALPQ